AVPTSTSKPGDTQRTIGWSVGGVGLAGLVVGSVQGLRAMGMDRELDRACGPSDASGMRPCGEARAGAIDDLRITANSATGLLVAGAVLTGAGVALLVTAPKQEEPASWASATVAPLLGPGTLGLSSAWRF
ncbi:MAG: hypothetical protein FJ096_20930, partial [Deltaproteobacteria bacterium]|nr:hypothetical protein [Deltaproteobacteria bacterium]